MAKLKAPFLSFGATGTVGKVLTVSKHRSLHVAKRIPLHPDARTAAQIAHRSLYANACDFWHTLPNYHKAHLLTSGRPHGITGYNLLLRWFLTDALRLTAWWPFNDGGPPTALDYSLRLYHGTIFGCTPVPDFCGQDNNALDFDGVNNYVRATTPDLNFTTGDFSFTVRIRPTNLTINHSIVRRGDWAVNGYWWMVNAAGVLYFYTFQGAAAQGTNSGGNVLAPGTWYTIGVSRAGANVKLYIDGIDVTAAPGVHFDPTTCPLDLFVGILQDATSNPLDARLCNLRVYSYAITEAEHLLEHQSHCVPPPR